MPSDQYVLFVAAIQAARDGDDLALCHNAANSFAALYDVDAFALDVDSALEMPLLDASVSVTDANRNAAVALVRRAVSLREYGTAARLMGVLRSSAAGDPLALRQLELLAREVAARHAESDRLAAAVQTLKKSPADPQANLAVGEDLCFIQRQWDAGLPHLARGADAGLKSLSQRDLSGPADADEQAELGNAWWDAAEKRSGAAKLAMRTRAYKWLASALPQLKGIKQIAAHDRLALSPFLDSPVGPVLRFSGHDGPVNEVAFSSDGSKAVSCGDDHTIRLWDLLTGKELRQFNGHQDPVLRLSAALKGRLFLTSGTGGTVCVWDLESSSPVHQWELHDYCSEAAVSPDGSAAVIASNNSAAKLYSTTTFKPAESFEADGSYAAAWSADGRVFATGGWSGFANVFDARTLKQVAHVANEDQIYGLALSPDGRRMLVGGANHVVRLWDLANRQEISHFVGGPDTVRSLAFTPDGRFALASGEASALTVWDLDSGKPAYSFKCPSHNVRGVAISRDGRLALSAGADGTARVWKMPDLPIGEGPLGQ